MCDGSAVSNPSVDRQRQGLLLVGRFRNLAGSPQKIITPNGATFYHQPDDHGVIFSRDPEDRL